MTEAISLGGNVALYGIFFESAKGKCSRASNKTEEGRAKNRPVELVEN